MPTKERKTCAFIIEDSDKYYKTILNGVKTQIGSDLSSKIIKEIRSTKDGKLLMITDTSDEAAKELKSLMEKATDTMKDRRFAMASKMEIIHIKGLNATTQKENVENAIATKLDNKDAQFKVSDLRPNISYTMAATLAIGCAEAERVLRDDFIRVNLVRCPAQKRINVPRCSKFWSYDYKVVDCKGLDRKGTCYRCGKPGHTHKDYENEEAYPVCETSGHKAGSGKCQKFKRALSNVKNLNGTSSYSRAPQEHQLTPNTVDCPNCKAPDHKQTVSDALNTEN
ncbi:hypothetical protein NQ314_015891 [Rhamnusium bicolor]|uniref:CCHC-type domain-containing protein n=1 Tax=Rhamnusium bicolor TaxID=1586634 RepID=A0AAV8WYL8_9CUCU|nr:hypothetical protein NQ314_015891 [Rhamnusium bicolor]